MTLADFAGLLIAALKPPLLIAVGLLVIVQIAALAAVLSRINQRGDRPE